MTIDRRAILSIIPLALVGSTGAAEAAGPTSWDGLWSGLWGGTDATSIEILGDKVVGYSFKGTMQPVDTGDVTEKQLSFGTKLFTITLTRVSDTIAAAQFRSDTMGVAKADLTRR
jgi:hypothetical protein